MPKEIFPQDIDEKITALDSFIQGIVERDELSFSEIIDRLRKKRKERVVAIPLSIFKERSLGILEALVKYLKERYNLRYHDIAVLLNRDDRSIWTTYRNARKKFPKPFVIESSMLIPVSIFSNRKLGLLENLATYLKDIHHLKYREIALLIGRDNRTIWTCYRRAKWKVNAKQKK